MTVVAVVFLVDVSGAPTSGSMYPSGGSRYPSGGSMYPSGGSRYPSGGSKAIWSKRAYDYLSNRAPLLFPMKEEKGDPVLEQFSLEELYHMLELLDKIEADRSVDLTSSESKTFKYLLDSYVGRK